MFTARWTGTWGGWNVVDILAATRMDGPMKRHCCFESLIMLALRPRKKSSTKLANYQSPYLDIEMTSCH